MSAPVAERSSVRPSGIGHDIEAIMYRGNFGIAIETLITGPVANHRGMSRSKTLVYPFIMPACKPGRSYPIGIKAAEQFQCPFSCFILDVGYQVLRKQLCAGHFRKFIKRSEKTGFTPGKGKSIDHRRRIKLSGEFEQLVPVGRRSVDQVRSIMQQSNVDVARQAIEIAIDPTKLEEQRYEVSKHFIINKLIERRKKTKLRRGILRV